MTTRDVLRFFLSSEDQARIDPASIQVEDVVAQATFPRVATTLRVAFRITNPAQGAPKILPLFPGWLRFNALPAGTLPDPASITFGAGSSAAWPTRGMLLVTASRQALADMRTKAAGRLLVVPNRAWYEPVQLSESFLFRTIAGQGGPGLSRQDLAKQGATPKIRSNDSDWGAHAIKGFLGGIYAPELKAHSTDPAQDEVVILPMPEVVMDSATGQVELYVTVALHGDLQQEGTLAAFARIQNASSPDDTSSPGDTDPFWPRHARNGVIPARHVFQQMGPKAGAPGYLVGASEQDPLLSQVIGTANPKIYVPVEFTRSWARSRSNGQPIDEFSPFLARARVRMTRDDSGETLWDDFLPAHGKVFVESPAESAQAVFATAELVDGDMYWTAGGADNWRADGTRFPITIDLTEPNSLHIVLRRPMQDAMVVEGKKRGSGCTYLSLRRTLLALIDNRIAGGRLYGNDKNLARELIVQAWPASEPGAAPGVLFDEQLACDPDEVDDANLILRAILVRFFGGDEGGIAYDLWQSTIVPFQDPDPVERARFPDEHIGRGAPGALVFLGLGSYLEAQNSSGGPAQPFFTLEETAQLLAGLRPGAVLQFWNDYDDWEKMRTRDVTLVPNEENPLRLEPQLNGTGHSTVFHSYMTDGVGNVTGMRVYDQDALSKCPYLPHPDFPGKQMIQSQGLDPVVWIAANWKE